MCVSFTSCCVLDVEICSSKESKYHENTEEVRDFSSTVGKPLQRCFNTRMHGDGNWSRRIHQSILRTCAYSNRKALEKYSAVSHSATLQPQTLMGFIGVLFYGLP